MNPFVASLFVIAGATLIIGLIVLLVGYRLTQSADATNIDPAAGLAQLAIGSQLESLGFVALMIALGAAAVTWRAPVAATPDPGLADSL